MASNPSLVGSSERELLETLTDDETAGIWWFVRFPRLKYRLVGGEGRGFCWPCRRFSCKDGDDGGWEVEDFIAGDDDFAMITAK